MLGTKRLSKKATRVLLSVLTCFSALIYFSFVNFHLVRTPCGLSIVPVKTFPAQESLNPHVSSGATEDGEISIKTRKSAVVCAIVKKERLYIDEWVDYHLGLGFEKIYIYDNSVDFDMRGWEVMKNQEWFGCEPARRDVVKVFHFPGDMQQTSAYDTCTLRARDEGHEWAAFFDVDEFLVLHQHADVVTFLEEYCSVGALGISWRKFGTNNETEYIPLPVTKRFTLGAAEPDRHIKSIAKLDHVLEVGHVHFVTKFMANYCTIDTNRRRVDGPFNRNPPSNIAVLHHYHTKSVGEYRLKRARGRADINCSDSAFTEPCEQLHIMSTTSTLDTLPVGEKFDDLVWQTLKYNIPAYKDGSPKNGTSRC